MADFEDIRIVDIDVEHSSDFDKEAATVCFVLSDYPPQGRTETFRKCHHTVSPGPESNWGDIKAEVQQTGRHLHVWARLDGLADLRQRLDKNVAATNDRYRQHMAETRHKQAVGKKKLRNFRQELFGDNTNDPD